MKNSFKQLCFSIGIFFVFPALAENTRALDALRVSIEQQSDPCSCYRLQTTAEDVEVFSVNYYEGLYRELLKSPRRLEYEKRFGNKRKWIVSKNAGIGESVYFVGRYDRSEEKFSISKFYSLQFKNYCEEKGKITDDYSRIKTAKLTFYEAPFHFGNNGLQVRLNSALKKTKEFDIDIKDFEVGNSILPNYVPKGTTTIEGTVFAVEMTVMSIYPGKKSQSLCIQDLNLGNSRSEIKP
ncbi:hypothetical protein [Leptospira yasudae]|uniref:Uncharacterized protein n=1 Tax=Leptospira yasudae TaxID=2202201 RepID=A0A6N4QZE8_9LEPT|nr:hypothetical protein [Leptospira yasudae]TGL79177.1 hypothetical protein EHQ72_09420 [Leptospira yasudae]TGL83075.1 hypothetical protein EHQ77_02135 [Leptospira yasudae]TGL85694.1 hypothetical protein EHQ83_07550 [Leptospira yasudae]